MKRYVNDLAKADREKWQLSEVDKAMAFMPIFVLSAIWGINELAAYLERRKKKPKSRR